MLNAAKKNRNVLANIPVGGIARIMTGAYAGQNVHVSANRHGQMRIVMLENGEQLEMGANKLAKQVIRVAKFR